MRNSQNCWAVRVMCWQTVSQTRTSAAVLDLQFGHSQRVGYDVATNVLNQLQGIGALHKRRPEHASTGVLRSPDIPSILVETGFISNNAEERLLGSDSYQQQIAEAIYNGLRKYFDAHLLQSAPSGGAGRGQRFTAGWDDRDQLRRHHADSGSTAAACEPNRRR